MPPKKKEEVRGLSAETALSLLGTMLKIRAFEEKVAELFRNGRLPGFVHLCLGQEATATGACAALKPDDYITSTHRGHGHCIAKGADLRLMMAELFGKRTGYSKGKGGSMHIFDANLGILGANGILGAGLPIGVGAALSARVRGTEQVVISFFGEGASGEGTVHEAMNMAALWKLPIIFFCETNRYAELTPYEKHVSVEQISLRAHSYGFGGITIDGNDVEAVYQAVVDAVRKARLGEGPTLIEAKTCRWHGHYEGDPQVYRPEGEIDYWKAKDPILVYEDKLQKRGWLSGEMKSYLHSEAERLVQEAVAFAETSPDPELHELLEDVYV